jgi:octaprenyl-diphosphate synthase
MQINHPIELTTIKATVADGLVAIDQLIKQQLFSNVSLISEICKHLMMGGGKRLRPLLVLLSAQMFNYQGQEHVFIATVIEFLHAATLLHDDVIDNSTLRHHRKTANTIWGNTSSVLVGDYLHVLSFQILNQLANHRATEIIVDGTRITVEGEVLQLMHRNVADITEAKYKEIIQYKTAHFFTVAAQLGAVISKCSEQNIAAMANYGTHLGMAYQLIDDALDYSANTATIGKNIGDDLTEGKPTLPLIYAMRCSNETDATIIRQAISEGGIEKIDIILKILHKTQAIEYTIEQARQHIDKAIASLPLSTNSQAYFALKQLAKFVIQSHC